MLDRNALLPARASIAGAVWVVSFAACSSASAPTMMLGPDGGRDAATDATTRHDSSHADGHADARDDGRASDARAEGAASEAGEAGSGPAVRVHAVFGNTPTGLPSSEIGAILGSPLVDGVSTALAWNAVDFGPDAGAPGQYQWTAFDIAIAPYVAAGKKVNLLVQPMNYDDPPGGIPTYVANDPSLQRVSCSGTTNAPVVYASGFKDPYKQFIAEVIRHYSGNANMGYVRIGLSVGNEVSPVCASTLATNMGLTLDKWKTEVWLAYDAEMLDFERSQKPTMSIEAPMTAFDNDDSWPDSEAANAVDAGFGFGCQGMQKTDITSQPKCTADFCKLFDEYAGLVHPLQLSTLAASDPTGAGSTGPLPPLLLLAQEYHATDLEIYPSDLLLALDPTYCTPSGACAAEYGAWYACALSAVRSGLPPTCADH